MKFITSLLGLLFCYKGLNIHEGELWQITKTLHETIKKEQQRRESPHKDAFVYFTRNFIIQQWSEPGYSQFKEWFVSSALPVFSMESFINMFLLLLNIEANRTLWHILLSKDSQLNINTVASDIFSSRKTLTVI